MATKSQRIFAGFFAGLFLLTSSALTIVIILQATQSNKDKPDNGKTSTPAETNTKDKTMLQGTKLANFTPGTPITELQGQDTTPGTGAVVKAGDTVTVDYTGAVAATGVIFQSSKDSGQPVSFPLNQVIAGWSQGIPGMKVGGTRRLLIPAALAYGGNPPQGSGIPANADLVFDVTLHKIGQ
jgi:FKBP-type peptidyl-prolyl cis-trans isomerase